MHSDDELKQLSIKAFENALELLQEAEILYAHQKLPRAFCLAHLATEELAKLPIIYGARVRMASGEEINWKRFKARLSRHIEKLKAIALFDYMNDEVDLEKNSDYERYRRQLESAKTLDTVKNISLYSGYHENTPYKPSEQVLQHNAELMITLTRGRMECLKTRWSGMIWGDVDNSGIEMVQLIRVLIRQQKSDDKVSHGDR